MGIAKTMCEAGEGAWPEIIGSGVLARAVKVQNEKLESPSQRCSHQYLQRVMPTTSRFSLECLRWGPRGGGKRSASEQQKHHGLYSICKKYTLSDALYG